MQKDNESKLIIVGWRERVALPELGISRIKAKIDTGARTSTLHAFAIRPFKEDGKHKVEFGVHPLQFRSDKAVTCVADVVDIRRITDTGGHAERRYIIKTLLQLGEECWPIELALTNRDTMRFRMLLGRTAVMQRFIINPAISYIFTKKKRS